MLYIHLSPTETISRGVALIRQPLYRIYTNQEKFFYIDLEMDLEPEQYADEFAIHRLLGEGGQANVYLGTREGHAYALKVYASGPTKEAAYRTEAELLGKMKHPHLINMVCHRPQAKIKLDKRPEERRPLIVLQLAEGGELFDFISKTGGFSAELARTYLKQLLSAIAYLAEVGITHRDLKPENILFDANFNLKVSDFGLARDAKGQNGNGQLTSRVGTEGYRAPEVEAGNYEGLKADMFAIGVILFILYKGTPPFLSTKSHDRVYRLIRERRYPQFWQLHEKGREPGFFSDAFKRLLNSFLSAEPDRRPTFDSLEQDEWMGGNTLSQEELLAEMTARASSMGLKTFAKRNLAADSANLEGCKKEGHRSEIDLEDETTTKEEVFAHAYNNSHIKAQSLPVVQRPTAVYINEDANVVFGWLNSFLFQQLRSKAPFLADFVEELAFMRYSVEYQDEKKELHVRLTFEVGEQEETQLLLVGALHRSPAGKVGVEWAKMEGNSFWLAAIKTRIEESFQALL